MLPPTYESEKTKVRRAKRAARERGLPAHLTTDQWLEIVAWWGTTCPYCRRQTNSFTLDHVVPLCCQGGTIPGNVLPCCKRCNDRKGNLDLDTFLSRLHGVYAHAVKGDILLFLGECR